MASDPIHISDDSELARVLDEVQGENPVLLEHKGRLYSVSRLAHSLSPDLQEAYDPDTLRDAIEGATGIFSEEEAEEMIRKIYEYREAGSRPATRP